jgi:hypothetical protein
MEDRRAMHEMNKTQERKERLNSAITRALQPRALPSAAAAMLCMLAACGGADAPAGTTPPTAAAGTGPIATLPTTAGTHAAPVAGSAALLPVTVAPGIKGTAGAPATTPSNTLPDGASTLPAAGAEILPCNVSKTLASGCQSCHGATPIGGAPMSLVTYADLHKPSISMPTMQVYQVAKLRIHDVARPMPPTSVAPLAAADLASLDTWFDGGALTGGASDATCGTAPTGTVTPAPGVSEQDGSRGALVPGPGEKCYEFKTHNSTTSVDNTPYDVGPDGEHYEQFYFKVPWPADTVATSYATIIDNAKVLHHWLLFATNENQVEGAHITSALPTLIGTDPVLLAGWAVGGPNVVPPKDVGFELPNPGSTINVQWHFYNSTGMDQKDASSLQICTVPKSTRPHIGNVTWLGTEDLGGNKWAGGPGMPPHQMSTYTTMCNPARAGMNATDSIHIIGFEPHMHKIGQNMKTSVVHTDGKMDVIFDKPFSFGNETHYFADFELKAGEKLVTSCSFNNTSDVGVPFGESSDTEMCYQFTFAWPAHAMGNGAFSLLGVTDTCW